MKLLLVGEVSQLGSTIIVTARIIDCEKGLISERASISVSQVEALPIEVPNLAQKLNLFSVPITADISDPKIFLLNLIRIAERRDHIAWRAQLAPEYRNRGDEYAKRNLGAWIEDFQDFSQKYNNNLSSIEVYTDSGVLRVRDNPRFNFSVIHINGALKVNDH